MDLPTHFVRVAKIKVENEITVGDSKKPTHLLARTWTRGSPLAVDVAVTHPPAPSLGLSLEAAKKAVERKAQRKIQKYSELVAVHRIGFTPAALSTCGKLGEDAGRFPDEAAYVYSGAQQVPRGEEAQGATARRAGAATGGCLPAASGDT